MTMTLYHVDWCPDCEQARQKLVKLGLAYHTVIVPDIRPMRKEVYEVSGQYYVPVLKDDDLVLTETADILAYLDERYGPGGAGPAAATRFRPQNCTAPDAPSEDDDHPSCRIN